MPGHRGIGQCQHVEIWICQPAGINVFAQQHIDRLVVIGAPGSAPYQVLLITIELGLGPAIRSAPLCGPGIIFVGPFLFVRATLLIRILMSIGAGFVIRFVAVVGLVGQNHVVPLGILIALGLILRA